MNQKNWQRQLCWLGGVLFVISFVLSIVACLSIPESTVGIAPWLFLMQLCAVGFFAGGLTVIPIQIAVILLLLEVKFAKKLFLALVVLGGVACGLLMGAAFFVDITRYLDLNAMGEIRYFVRCNLPMCIVCASVPLFVYRMLGGKPIRRMELTGETRKISLKMVFVMMTALAVATFWTSVDAGEFTGTGQRLEMRQQIALCAGGAAAFFSLFYLIDVRLLLRSKIKLTWVLAIGITRIFPVGFVAPFIFFSIILAIGTRQVSFFQKMIPSLLFLSLILGGYLAMTLFFLVLRRFGLRLAVIDLRRD